MVEPITLSASPALDHIIERPRLIARLVEGDARVAVFAAPAGYGKTTLARQWAERQTGPVAWYHATRASGDVAALAVELDELLASVAPELPRDPGRVARIASVNPSPRPLSRALVQTYEPLTQDALLIVDEWEAAGTDEAEQLLSTLVDGLDIRFLITSRTRPVWFTPRLEVYGEGLEIGVDELTMTDEEAAEVLSLSRATSGRARLVRSAQGWPAVLGLAAMSGEMDVAPERLMSRPLYDFLATELLASVTPETQEVLMLLAVTSVTTSRQAAALLRERAEHLKEAMVRGLFGNDGRDSLALHPLLRELLIERVVNGNAELRANLLAQCRTLLTEHLWNEALSVAEACPEREFVSDAIGAALPDLLASGRTSSLVRWVAAARSAGAEGGEVDYAESEALFRAAEFDRALVLAARAAAALKGDLAARAHLLAARAAHLGNRPSERDRHLESANRLAAGRETISNLHWLRFASATAEERPESEALLEEFERATPPGHNRDVRVAEAYIHLGLTQGRLEARVQQAELNISVLDDVRDPYAKSSLLNIYSNALSALGRYEDALNATARGCALADEYGLEFVAHYALINRARALTGLRRFAQAKRALSEVERRLRLFDDPYVDCQRATYTAALYLSIGDVDRAVDALASGADARAGSSLVAEHDAMKALVLAAAGRVTEAQPYVEMAREKSRAVETRALLEAARAVQSARQGDDAGLRSACEAILDLGVRDALVLAWRVNVEVAKALVEDPRLREHAMRLFVEANDSGIARRAGVRVPREVRKVAGLSPREREVYELVAQGLTNDEISRLLYISLSTTKVHVKHILEKLGVRSRLEAARAWYDEQDAGERSSEAD